MTTIKVNNKTITIANKSNESLSFSDLDKESKSLESLALNIEKSVEALNIVSNIKAIESFGYKSTEGVGKKIKAGVIAVKNKLIEWFKKLIEFFKNLQAKIATKNLIPKEMGNIAGEIKTLFDSFHQCAKKNIETISKGGEGEDVNKLKLKQQKCNLLRQYTLLCIRLISPKILAKDAVNASNGELPADDVVNAIINSNSYNKLANGVSSFIKYAQNCLTSDFEGNDSNMDFETFKTKLEKWKSSLDNWKNSLMNEVKSKVKPQQQTNNNNL